MDIILVIVALIVFAAIGAVIVYNHKSIDAVAARLDETVAPAVQAAKPVVTQSIAEIDAQVAAAVAAKPADAVSADVAGSQPKAQ